MEALDALVSPSILSAINRKQVHNYIFLVGKMVDGDRMPVRCYGQTPDDHALP